MRTRRGTGTETTTGQAQTVNAFSTPSSKPFTGFYGFTGIGTTRARGRVARHASERTNLKLIEISVEKLFRYGESNPGLLGASL